MNSMKYGVAMSTRYRVTAACLFALAAMGACGARPLPLTTQLVGRWMFVDGACSASTNFTFGANGSGESKGTPFTYTVNQATVNVVWPGGSRQTYQMALADGMLTTDLDGHVCRWRRD